MVNSLPLKEDESRYSGTWPLDCFVKAIPRPHRVALHYHRTLEINLFRHCRGSVRVGSREMDLSDVPVLVIPPLLPHSYDIPGSEPPRGPSREVVVFHLSLENLAPLLQLENVLGWSPSVLTVPVSHPAYEALVEIVPRVLSLDKNNRLALLENIVKILKVLDQARRSLASASAPPHRYSARMNESLLEVIRFTEKSYTKNLSLEVVAGHLGWSRSYFCRYFKNATGENYRQYLQSLRIDRAKIELTKGASVTEACFGSGFGNLSYFIHLFRSHEGVTPGKFRAPR